MNYEVLIPAAEKFLSGSKAASSKRHARSIAGEYYYDYWIVVPALILLGLGLVMVGSASVSFAEKHLDDSFYYLWRQLAYTAVGIILAYGVVKVRIDAWQKLGPGLLVLGIFLLSLVLLVGSEVNGSSRWISFGIANVQPSELIKIFVVVFVAGYMVQHRDEVRSSMKGFMKPMMLMAVIGILLLLEPDFGAAAVITMTTLGMLFIGGVRIRQFGVLFLVMAVAMAILAYSSPYRVARLTSFLNPWADPFNSGFQLTQALIAFGRGEWFGVGLGSSIQKLFYLPEAHTDFVFAVLSEELGLIGGVIVIGMFAIIVFRSFHIGRAALLSGNQFAAYLCFGLGLLLGLQAFINMGVNMGLLPTKGLTLPLMSYGGSSVAATCIIIALLLRCSHEHKPRQAMSVQKYRRQRS